MQIDRTWTITFDEVEQERIKQEVSMLELPTDLGRPLLLRIIGSNQITLPSRAIDRIVVEIDIARSNFLNKNNSLLDYRRRFPTVNALYDELVRLSNPHRRSA
ncbi:MAG: hypothetical protein HY819_07360 [Acidobacteria bacterium]|nr:hypothetical protein [Acidobacteriota bacterium]